MRDPDASAPDTTPTIRARVTNHTVETARARCDQCQGEWRRWGMRGTLGCNCRMPDAGKECRDGDECQGSCLFHHGEIVEAPRPVRCGRPGCKGRLGSVRFVGQCSERRMNFGLVTRIPSGASRDPPHPLPAHVPSVDVD